MRVETAHRNDDALALLVRDRGKRALHGFWPLVIGSAASGAATLLYSGITQRYLLLPETFMLMALAVDLTAISPDDRTLATAARDGTVRLWDIKTNDKLDKDRFRRDLGGLLEAYTEVARRLGIMSEGERPQGSGPVLVKG